MNSIIKIDEWGNVIIKDEAGIHFSHITDYSSEEQQRLEELAFDY